MKISLKWLKELIDTNIKEDKLLEMEPIINDNNDE